MYKLPASLIINCALESVKDDIDKLVNEDELTETMVKEINDIVIKLANYDESQKNVEELLYMLAAYQLPIPDDKKMREKILNCYVTSFKDQHMYNANVEALSKDHHIPEKQTAVIKDVYLTAHIVDIIYEKAGDKPLSEINDEAIIKDHHMKKDEYNKARKIADTLESSKRYSDTIDPSVYHSASSYITESINNKTKTEKISILILAILVKMMKLDSVLKEYDVLLVNKGSEEDGLKVITDCIKKEYKKFKGVAAMGPTVIDPGLWCSCGFQMSGFKCNECAHYNSGVKMAVEMKNPYDHFIIDGLDTNRQKLIGFIVDTIVSILIRKQ